MNETTKALLKRIIKAQIKQSFVPESQAQATDEEALGLILSKYFEWDGLAILKACSAALEDANFHSENRVLQEMIQNVEKAVA